MQTAWKKKCKMQIIDLFWMVIKKLARSTYEGINVALQKECIYRIIDR